MNNFCINCGNKLENNCNFCSSCGNVIKIKKKSNNSPFLIIIRIFGIIIAISGVFTIFSGLIGTSSDNETKSENTCYATLEKFNQIQKGTTYEEVVQYMGCEGTLSSDVGNEQYTIKIYYWYGEDNISNMVLSFDNNKLSGKNQIGLK